MKSALAVTCEVYDASDSASDALGGMWYRPLIMRVKQTLPKGFFLNICILPGIILMANFVLHPSETARLKNACITFA